MSRLDWLRERQFGLGGSDLGQIPSIVAAVGGDPEVDCSPWGSEWHVWASKQGEPEERAETEAMMTGRLLERAVADWAAQQVHACVAARQNTESFAHPETRVHLRGTPDYWLMAGEPFGDGLFEADGLECKVDDAWKPWEKVPLYYELQCRAYMALTERSRWFLAVFFRHQPAWRLYTIERDVDIEATMLEAVNAWWRRHIVDGEHPPIDETVDCTRALRALHPRTPGTTVADFRIADSEEVALAEEIRRSQQVVQMLQAEVDRDCNTLRASIGDAAGLRWSGGSVRWSRNKLTIKIDKEAP